MMEKEFFVNFLSLLINAYMLLIFVRVIMSWLPNQGGKFVRLINDLTDPILAPLRKVIPPLGGAIDITPLVAFLILNLLLELISRF